MRECAQMSDHYAVFIKLGSLMGRCRTFLAPWGCLLRNLCLPRPRRPEPEAYRRLTGPCLPGCTSTIPRDGNKNRATRST